MVLSSAEAGWDARAAPISPVLRLGLAYFARVAGLRRLTAGYWTVRVTVPEAIVAPEVPVTVTV